MKKKRRDMRPGEIFLAVDELWWRAWHIRHEHVLVVLDSETETDFWRGGLFCFGDVMPSKEFEVL